MRCVRCVLCGPIKEKEISCFSFPREEKLKLLWAKLCDMSIEHVRPSHRLCSNHFQPSDCIDKRGKGGLLRLKMNAVPSIINVKRKKNIVDLKQKANTSQVSIHNNSVIVKNELNLEPQTSTCENNTHNNSVIVKNELNLEPQTSTCENNTHNNSVIGKNELNLEPQTSTCENNTDNNSLNEGETKNRRIFEPRYVGDITIDDFQTPIRAKRTISLIKETFAENRKKIKTLQTKNWKLTKKLETLQDLLLHLKKKNLIETEAVEHILDGIPDNIKEIIDQRIRKRRRKYSQKIRIFALTLKFYSSRAYDYVRKTFNNLLPHPATLRKWYTVVDGHPGFTREAFAAISRRHKMYPNKQVLCNLVLDEIAIREQVLYHNNKFYGFVNMGTDISSENDNQTKANNALVFMAVGINDRWKIPVGYFLIKSLSSSERANLLLICLELLHEAGATVCSLCFDGAGVNIKMCTNLGADFSVNNLTPWIYHPQTKEKILIFWDPSHIIKLVRNTIGEKSPICYKGNVIDWKYIVRLQQYEKDEGLRAATKLTAKHINFKDNKMNVKLAAQVLSSSVSAALRLLEDTLHYSEFDNAAILQIFVKCLTEHLIY